MWLINNGDGKTDIAVFRPSTGVWYIKDQYYVQYGSSTDKLVPGDYDGDHKAEVAVFHPSTVTWDAIQMGTMFSQPAYTYDPVGNISQIQDTISGETQTFGYDALDRLTSATVSGTYGYSESYAYNSTSGNLTTKGSLSLGYNDNAHQHAVTHIGLSSSWVSDPGEK